MDSDRISCALVFIIPPYGSMEEYLVYCVSFMAALYNRAGHYIFAVVFFFFFFSSSNLSRRRLNVYHTSTHGVALARI